MKLMRLEPEASRLRRIAKAHAAGEMELGDYRDARRRVIEGFERSSGTEHAPTAPRYEVTEAGFRRVMPADGPSEMIWRRWRRTWWLAAAAAVVAVATASLALAAPRAAESALGATETRAPLASQHIPPLSERDPNPSTSRRYHVRDVRVNQDALTLAGIDADVLAQLITRSLAEVRASSTPSDHGFTGDELVEVGRFLQALGVHDTSGKLSARDARELADLIATQKSRRGISLEQLARIATTVRDHYRDAGYLLAQAYVPAQVVEDGVVALDVQVGRLASVTVTGTDHLGVTERFTDLLNTPVHRAAVETRLYQLNAVPGLNSEASFVAGAEVGETELRLNVTRDTGFGGTVQVDNDGTEGAGEHRVQALAHWSNPRGVGDRLLIGVVAGYSPSNQLAGGVDYRTPLGGRYELGARLTRNDFDWNGAFAAEGDAWLGDVELRRVYLHTRAKRFEARVGAGLHRFGWDGVPDQQAWLLRGAIAGHRLWDDMRVALDGSAGVDFGGIDEPLDGQEQRFWRAWGRAFMWKPANVPLLPGTQKLSLGFHGQWAGSHLPSSLRKSLGGADVNRGFQRGVMFADRSASLRAQVQVDAPLGEWLVFADTAYGVRLNDLQRGWGSLTSLGLGWQADVGQALKTRVSLGIPVSSKGSNNVDRGIEDEGAKIFWSLQYAH